MEILKVLTIIGLNQVTLSIIKPPSFYKHKVSSSRYGDAPQYLHASISALLAFFVYQEKWGLFTLREYLEFLKKNGWSEMQIDSASALFSPMVTNFAGKIMPPEEKIFVAFDYQRNKFFITQDFIEAIS